MVQAGLGDRADLALARAAALAFDDPRPFLDHGWWVAGPIPNGSELDPASHVDPSQSIGLAAGGRDSIAWTPARTGYDGWIDYQAALPTYEPIEVAALNWLYSTKDRETTLVVDATKPVRVWLNGQLVRSGQSHAVAAGAERVASPVRLRRGRNTLLIRTTASLDDSVVYLHVADPSDVDAPSGPTTYLAGADATAYRAWLDRMRKARYRPTYVHATGVDGRPRFAALATRDPDGPPWEARIDHDPAAWNQTYDELRKVKHHRIASISRFTTAGASGVASIWHEVDRPSAESFFDWHDLDSAALKAKIADEEGWGRVPEGITAYPVDASARFAVYGVPLEVSFWYIFGLELEPISAELSGRVRLGYHPVSATAYSDTGQTRFAMVLWRHSVHTDAVQNVESTDLRLNQFRIGKPRISSQVSDAHHRCRLGWLLRRLDQAGAACERRRFPIVGRTGQGPGGVPSRTGNPWCDDGCDKGASRVARAGPRLRRPRSNATDGRR